MKASLFNDRRTTGLLNRVRNDVSHLREDLGSLLTHTTRETLPNGARELADHAKDRLAAGGAYAASRLRNFHGQPHRREAGWVGGALLLGVIAYGAYALYRTSCESAREAREIEE